MALLFILICTTSSAFVSHTRVVRCFGALKLSDDWSGFQFLDDDEEFDGTDFAKEEDTQEYKAQVGASLEAPSIEMDADPILVPQGKMMTLVLRAQIPF